MTQTKRPFAFFSYLSYLLIRAVLGFIRILPVSFVYFLARCLGRLWYFFDARHRKVAEKNLRQAFSNSKSDQEIRRLVKVSFQRFACVIFEMILSDKYLTPAKWKKHFEFACTEQGRALLAQGKGVVLLSPHLGNWEAMGLTMGLAGFPFPVIARPLNNPYLQDYLTRMREANGMQILPRRGGFRSLIPTLRSGGIVGLLPDQNQRKRPIFVSWFGKLAATDRSAAFLALRFKAPIWIVAGLHTGPGFKFTTIAREVEKPPRTGDIDQDILALTQEIYRNLEIMVQQCPEQYFWLHDRYRTRPPQSEDIPLA